MRKYKLKEISNIYNGSTPSTSETDNYDGNIVWITPKDLSNQKCRYISQGERNITPKGYKSCSTTMLPKGTILLSSRAPIGLLAIAQTELCTNQGFKNIVPNNELVDSHYLYYLLKLKTKEIEALGSGTTFKEVSKNSLENYQIDIHDIEEQRKIVNVLSIIDDKIELNNKINKELEQMAKTLYEYWFVQFDFPDEKGRPYKSANGKMVYNDILKREIPEGWEVKNISSYCNIIDCLHSKKPDYHYEDDKCYLLQLENLTENGYINISSKYYISKKDYIYWTQKLEIKENDFVFTNAGRAGAFGKIPANIQCALGRNFTAIRPLHISPYYLRMYFASNDMKQQILSNLDCSAFFKSFNVKSIKLINLLLPKTSVLDTFVNQISPIIKKIEANNEEIQQLTNFRDFLLPLLMNGQVSVQN